MGEPQGIPGVEYRVATPSWVVYPIGKEMRKCFHFFFFHKTPNVISNKFMRCIKISLERRVRRIFYDFDKNTGNQYHHMYLQQ